MYKLITANTNILIDSNSISWNSDTDTLGTQLSFESIKDLFEGQVVSLFSDSRELIRGIVLKKKPNKHTWNYTVQDYSLYLKNKILIQFNCTKASDAVSSLLSGAYITGNIVDIPTSISTLYKNKSRSDVIDDILKQAQQDQGIEYFKEIEATTLYIRKLQDMRITPAILLPKDISPESTIENMKNRIEIVSNSESNNSIVAVAEDTSKRNWYGLLSDQIEVDDKNIAQAQNIANNTLSQSNVITRTCTINNIMVLSGGEDIKANRLIYLNAGSRLCGYYKIKSANHTLVKGTHKVNLTIEWKVSA